MSDTANLQFGSETYSRIVRKNNGLLYTRYVNRNAAWIFTRVLLGLSPNTVSVSAFALLVASLSVFIAIDNYSIAAVVALYVALSVNYILDSTDGQIARITGRGSPVGEWLDHSLDALRMTVIHGAFIYFCLRTNAPTYLLVVACLNIVIQPPLFASNLLRQKLLANSSSSQVGEARGVKARALRVLMQPADHGIFIMLTLLLIWPPVFHVAYATYGLYWVAVYAADMTITFRSNR